MRKAKSILHVNQHAVRANKKDGGNRPVITHKQRRMNNYGHTAEIAGPSILVYRPDKPLSCGARCWIETYADVTLR